MSKPPYEALDSLLAARGLTRDATALNASASWQGSINGRAVHIVSSIRLRTIYRGEIRTRIYQGHEFLIEVGTMLRTRLTMAPASSSRVAATIDRLLHKWIGLVVLESPAAEYDHLKLAAFEKPWALALLADPGVKRLLSQTLTPLHGNGGLFALRPGLALTRRRHALSEITPEYAATLLDAMLAIADVAEAMPAPKHAAHLSWIESRARTHPRAFVIGLFAVLLAAVLITSSVVLPLLFALAYFNLHGLVFITGIAAWFWWRRKTKLGKASQARLPD